MPKDDLQLSDFLFELQIFMYVVHTACYPKAYFGDRVAGATLFQRPASWDFNVKQSSTRTGVICSFIEIDVVEDKEEIQGITLTSSSFS